MIIDDATGAVIESAEYVDMVPLNLTALDEDEIAAMFPTPQQCVGALLYARQMIAQAPAVLAARSAALKAAKRDLIIARGYARQRANGRDAETRRLLAEGDPEVIDAHEAVDTAELALEYARDRRKSLSEDIDILRSLNANFRGEHS